MSHSIITLTVFTSLFITAIFGAENRSALIVGCNYPGSDLELPSPVKDASALANALTQVGFARENIDLLTNPTKAELVKACDQFHERLKVSGGVGLFYFSGHGAQVDGTNYLIPAKATVKFREHLKTEGLPASYIATNMEAADNGVNILILDACRNNPLPSATKKAFAPKGLARMDGDGILFCFAAKDGQEALDTGKGSAYTNALIANLATPRIDILRLLTKVRKDVKIATNNQQEPFFYSGLDDPFVFLPAAGPVPVTPRPTPEPVPVTPRPTPEPVPVTPRPAPAHGIAATKANPFTNSLGMKFVPVRITGGPTEGKKVLFSIWETRMQDYEVFQRANRSIDGRWKKSSTVGFSELHPVTDITWEDANSFCVWLTKKERMEKKIDQKDIYRLPTDHEWSCAVGIGDIEDPSDLPSNKNQKIKTFPWGENFPPPPGTGNLGKDLPYRTTAVGSFKPSPDGLYDLAGNVWEYCSDVYSTDPEYRVLRGGSFLESWETSHYSSSRQGGTRLGRNNRRGFRCVLASD